MICRLTTCSSRAIDNFVISLFYSNTNCELIIAGRGSRRDIISAFNINNRDAHRVWNFNDGTFFRLAAAHNGSENDPIIVLHEDHLNDRDRDFLNQFANTLQIFCISLHEGIGISILNSSAVARINITDSMAESVPDPNQGTFTVKQTPKKKPKRKKPRSNRTRFDVLEI